MVVIAGVGGAVEGRAAGGKWTGVEAMGRWRGSGRWGELIWNERSLRMAFS